MKTLPSIYSQYKIMPSLQKHQLRVAAVAKAVCGSVSAPLDSRGIIITCLFHDMGNIIKFDLDYFPDFLAPEGLRYWQEVKDEFIEKYGNEEHLATEKICREIGLPEKQLGYLSVVGFSKVGKVVAEDSLENKICCYSDQRVGPYGVLSIEERLEEGKRRYNGTKHKALVSGRFEELARLLKKLESQIFAQASNGPDSISNESITDDVLNFSLMEIPGMAE
jgi:hypothetical protein